MTWRELDTAGKIDAIRRAWDDKASVSEIASRIPGANRNAIAGMYNRNPDLASTHPLRSWAASMSARKRRQPEIRNPKGKTRKPTVKPIIVRIFDEPHTAPVTLMGLGRRMCKWAVNDTPPFLFCGTYVEEGSWCQCHAKIAFGRGTESERSAVRVLRREMAW